MNKPDGINLHPMWGHPDPMEYTFDPRRKSRGIPWDFPWDILNTLIFCPMGIPIYLTSHVTLYAMGISHGRMGNSHGTSQGIVCYFKCVIRWASLSYCTSHVNIASHGNMETPWDCMLHFAWDLSWNITVHPMEGPIP